MSVGNINSTPELSGTNSIDGLISGQRWAQTTITYSFTWNASQYEGGASGLQANYLNNGYAAFNTSQILATRAILADIEARTGLDFVEVDPSTTPSSIKFANSSYPATSEAYYPGESSGGNVWIGNHGSTYTNAVVNSYAYYGLVHEIGHALGLKHPTGAGGTNLAYNLDYTDRTVMSYNYPGDPDYVANGGNEGWQEVLQDLDITSLNFMYTNDVKSYVDSHARTSVISYEAFLNVVPSEQGVVDLNAFVANQQSYATSIGVANPELYGFEALGLALTDSRNSYTGFDKVYVDSGYGGNDWVFVYDAYVEAFGYAPTGAQQTHFVNQIAYFENLYAANGHGALADVHAHGAVFGQMLGYADQGNVGKYDSAANYFMVDAESTANGALTFGASMLDTYANGWVLYG